MNDTILAHRRSAHNLFKYVESRGNAGNGTTQDQMNQYLLDFTKLTPGEATNLVQALIEDGAFNPTTGA